MPAKKSNIIEQHLEKAVLAITAVVVLYCLIVYLLGTPVKTEIAGETAKPGQAYGLLVERVKTIEQKTTNPLPTDLVFTSNDDDEKTPDVSPNTPRKVTELPPIVSLRKEQIVNGPGPGIDPSVRQRQYDLPTVVKPQRIAVHSGRSTVRVDLTAAWTEDLIVTGDRADVSWVTVAAEIDLDKQGEALADLPDLPAQGPYFIRVDLQRAEVTAQGTLSPWETVPSLEPDALLLDPLKDTLKVDAFRALRDLRDQILSQPEREQAIALNPDFPPVIVGTTWDEPLIKGEKPKAAEPGTRRPTRRAAEPRRPPGRGRDVGLPGAGGAGMGGRGGRRGGVVPGRPGPGGAGPRAMPGMAPEMFPGAGLRGAAGPGMAPPGGGVRPARTFGSGSLVKTDKGLKIWAHDLTASLGKTYCYRMRVIMYNPLAGWTFFLKDKDDLLTAGLPSPWSDSSSPVTIPQDVYFFVKGTLEDRDGASIEVYKWHLGWLCKKRFNVDIGQVVGSKSVTRFYREDGTRLHEEKGEVDFDTGAVLLSSQSPVSVAVRDRLGKTGEFDIRTETQATLIVAQAAGGNLVRQDTANVKSDPSWRICKNIIDTQGKKLKELEVVKLAASGRGPARR